MNQEKIAECDRALDHLMSDVGELNYWATRIGFQAYNVPEGKLFEIYIG